MSSDDYLRASLERMLTGMREPLEAELRAYAAEHERTVARAAEQAADAAAAEVLAQTERRLTNLRETATKELNAAREAGDAALAAAQQQGATQLEEARKAAQEQVAELERALQEQRARSARELEDARGAAQGQVAELERALQEQRARSTRELEEARHELAAARRQMDDALTRAADADARLADRLAAVRDEVRNEEAGRIVEAADRAARERQDAELVRMRQLVDATAALDDAQSLGEVLDLLAQYAAREAGRSAVLTLRAGRLRDWRLIGFADGDSRQRAVDLSVEEAGLVGTAVRTQRPALRTEHTDVPDGETAAPPFAGADSLSDAAALPVSVGGDVVAVVYADASSSAEAGGPRWPAVLEVLARHAGRVLEALTLQQALGLGRPVARASQPAPPGRSLSGSAS